MRNTMLGSLLVILAAGNAWSAHHSNPPFNLNDRGADGLFPTNQKYDRLRLRRAINPARFDHYHPVFGSQLGMDIQLRVGMEHLCGPINGLLPQTPYLNYVRFRRSLNPARFDHYHPRWGPLIAMDQMLRANMPTCPTPVQTVPSSGSPGGSSFTLAPSPSGTSGGSGSPSPGGATGGETGQTPPVTTPPLNTPPVTTPPINTPPVIPPPITTPSETPPPVIPPPSPAVPEPASLVLMAIGSTGIMLPGLIRRWRRRGQCLA